LQLLDPVYPNPFIVGGGGLATVSYHLKDDGPVDITITDAFGTVVKHISNISESAGDHVVTVGPETISRPGTYYVTVEADNTKSTQKVSAVQ
jgi:flagellar hook assembly protein FlgD